MPITNIVEVTTLLQNPPAGRPGFGIPAAFADLTVDQDAAIGSDRFLEVTQQNWQTEFANIGILPTEAPYLAFQAMFSQQRVPTSALLARRDDPVALVETFTVGGTTDGTYSVDIDGTVYQFVASSNTADQIRDGLVTAIGSNPDHAVAAAGGAGQFTLTATTAGVPFTSLPSSPGDILTKVTTTPGHGLAEDLALLKAQRDDFYFVLKTSRDDDEAFKFAATIEAETRRLFVYQTSDADAPTVNQGDSGYKLSQLDYDQTAPTYNPTDTQYAEFAWVGKQAPTDPGSTNWHAQAVVGIAGFVPTSITQLQAKSYSWAERFEAQGDTLFQDGKVASGRFIDQIRGVHWLDSEIEARFYEFVRDSDKIAYTDDGIAQAEAVLRGALNYAADRGFLDPDTISIAVVDAIEVPDADKGVRIYRGLSWSAEEQGAINKFEISGVVGF